MTSGSRPQPTVHQGDLYWLRVDDPGGGGPGIPHPYVVVQDDALNHSPLATVVACALTSNLKRASWAGNVLLAEGEANLQRPSVVEVSKIATVEKAQLGAWIGRLSPQRVEQILAGQRLVQRSFFGVFREDPPFPEDPL